jgi:hypothetical protein
MSGYLSECKKKNDVGAERGPGYLEDRGFLA